MRVSTMVFVIRNFIFLSFFNSILATVSYADTNKDFQLQRCINNPQDFENIVTQSDFKWGISHAANRAKETEIYQSGKRLYLRAYYDQAKGAYVLPHTLIGEESVITLTKQFIDSVTHHIEIGLRNKYSEAIVFSDMGHSHLYFPIDHWEKEYKDFVNASPQSKIYEKMLSDKKLRVLYHTAEQIKLKENDQILTDPWAQWRYHSRNVMGYTNGQRGLEVLYAKDNKRYNTVIEVEGFHRWSAGFNISASKKGCFPYQVNGETRYFDISLESLPYSKHSWLAKVRNKIIGPLVKNAAVKSVVAKN